MLASSKKSKASKASALLTAYLADSNRGSSHPLLADMAQVLFAKDDTMALENPFAKADSVKVSAATTPLDAGDAALVADAERASTEPEGDELKLLHRIDYLYLSRCVTSNKHRDQHMFHYIMASLDRSQAEDRLLYNKFAPFLPYVPNVHGMHQYVERIERAAAPAPAIALCSCGGGGGGGIGDGGGGGGGGSCDNCGLPFEAPSAPDAPASTVVSRAGVGLFRPSIADTTIIDGKSEAEFARELKADVSSMLDAIMSGTDPELEAAAQDAEFERNLKSEVSSLLDAIMSGTDPALAEAVGDAEFQASLQEETAKGLDDIFAELCA